MSQPIIIDAGPALNFFSIKKERLLFSVTGQIQAPEVVIAEIQRKAKHDSRFARSRDVLAKLPDTLLTILSDTISPDLKTAAKQLGILYLEDRQLQAKDLGETMVVLHAMVHAKRGHDVITLIDDIKGQALASRAARILDRVRNSNPNIGKLEILSTTVVLENAVKKRIITDKTEIREIYEKMRQLDDGLVHISQTQLLDNSLWRPREK